MSDVCNISKIRKFNRGQKKQERLAFLFYGEKKTGMQEEKKKERREKMEEKLFDDNDPS